MKIGIALSGGGIRGIAHAGVLKALEDNGIKINIIGGTSSGSMIAMLYASGYSPYNIYTLFKKYSTEIAKINTKPIIKSYMLNKKVTLKGLKTGNSIERIFNEVINMQGIYNISDIKMPVVVPTVDLIDCKEYVFTNNPPEEKEKYITDISVGKAIRASSSFTAVFSPCEYKEHAFIDGGALDNIPIKEVKKQGADIVIGVKFNSEKITQESNIMDMTMKTIDIMGTKISEENLKQADYILNVYTDKTGLLDTEKLDSCYKYGYNAVIENLDKIQKLIQKGNQKGSDHFWSPNNTWLIKNNLLQ